LNAMDTAEKLGSLVGVKGEPAKLVGPHLSVA
jgi:hypothetical protein